MIQENQNSYFEKQDKFSLQCGLHSINNLLGDKIYRSSDLIEICNQLSGDCINPHRHIFGGDYDANVLFIALQKQGLQCQWHDKRKEFRFDTNFQRNIFGYLINIRQKRQFYHKILGISARHWTSLKKQKNNCYTFYDSRLDGPQRYTNQNAVLKYVHDLVNDGSQVIYVIGKSI